MDDIDFREVKERGTQGRNGTDETELLLFTNFFFTAQADADSDPVVRKLCQFFLFTNSIFSMQLASVRRSTFSMNYNQFMVIIHLLPYITVMLNLNALHVTTIIISPDSGSGIQVITGDTTLQATNYSYSTP